jgi:hypothetical protein
MQLIIRIIKYAAVMAVPIIAILNSFKALFSQVVAYAPKTYSFSLLLLSKPINASLPFILAHISLVCTVCLIFTSGSLFQNITTASLVSVKLNELDVNSEETLVLAEGAESETDDIDKSLDCLDEVLYYF